MCPQYGRKAEKKAKSKDQDGAQYLASEGFEPSTQKRKLDSAVSGDDSSTIGLGVIKTRPKGSSEIPSPKISPATIDKSRRRARRRGRARKKRFLSQSFLHT